MAVVESGDDEEVTYVSGAATGLAGVIGEVADHIARARIEDEAPTA